VGSASAKATKRAPATKVVAAGGACGGGGDDGGGGAGGGGASSPVRPQRLFNTEARHRRPSAAGAAGAAGSLPASSAVRRAHAGSARLGDVLFTGMASSRLELLPAELLAQLAEWLGEDFGALLALQGTSRALRRLAAEQVSTLHWGRMGKQIRASGFSVAGLLRSFPRVRELHLQGCSQAGDGLCQLLARHAPGLVSLSLGGTAVTDVGLRRLVPGSAGHGSGGGGGGGLSQLERLDLSSCTALSAAALARSLARLPALHTLSLRMCPTLDDAVLHALAGAEEGGLLAALPPWAHAAAAAQRDQRQREAGARAELSALLGARQPLASSGGPLLPPRRRLSVVAQLAGAQLAGGAALAQQLGAAGGGGAQSRTTFSAILPPPQRRMSQEKLPAPMPASALLPELAPMAGSGAGAGAGAGAAAVGVGVMQGSVAGAAGWAAAAPPAGGKARLTSLDVSKCLRLGAGCVPALARMTALTRLGLGGCSRLAAESRRDLSALVRPQTSQVPSAWGAARGSLAAHASSGGLAPLRALTALQDLDLSDVGCGVRDAAWLADLRALRRVDLSGLEALGGLAFLSPLHLARASMAAGLQRTPRPSVVSGAAPRPLAAPPMGALTALVLHGCVLVDDDVLRQMRSVIPRLQRLCLHGVGPTTDAALGALLGRAGALTDLDASKTGFGDQAAAALARAAPPLRRLRLRKCSGLKDEAVRRIGTVVAPQCELRVLDISCCSLLTLHALGTFCAPQQQQQQQQQQRRRGQQVQQAQAQRMPAALPLRSLDMSWLPRAEGTGSLAQLRQLRSLSLLGCVAIDDDSVLCLRHATALVSLNLKWCHQITDVAIEGCFAKLSHLSVLNLKGCVGLTDRGMNTLSGVTTLTRLNVSLSRRLTYRGVAVLRLLPHIEQLLVSICEDSASHHM